MGPSVSNTPPSPSRGGAVIAAVLLLADLVKHALLFLGGLEQPWPDSAGYWRLGSVVADGDVWMQGPALGYRTPGYPWFLGGMIRLLGPESGFCAAIALQHAAAIGTDLLVAWWTWRLTGSRRATFLAGTWLALSTARPLYANWLLTESLATLLLTASAYLIWSNRPHRTSRLVPAAMAAGVGILIRPSLVVLAPVLGAAAVVDGWRRPASIGARLARASVPLFVLLLVITPWCERNRQLFGRWTLLTFTGRELWTANFSPWPGAGLDIPADGPAEELRQRVASVEESVDLRHNTVVAGLLVRSGLNDAQADRLMEQVARKAILLAPGRSLFHVIARTGTFWYCKEYPPPPVAASVEATPFSRLAQPRFPAIAGLREALLSLAPERTFLFTWIVSGLTWLSLLVCLFVPPGGAPVPIVPLGSPVSDSSTVAGTRRAAWILGPILAGTTLLTATLEIPLYRYRLPLEPLGIVLVFAGGAAIWSRFRGRPALDPGAPKRSAL